MIKKYIRDKQQNLVAAEAIQIEYIDIPKHLTTKNMIFTTFAM